MVEAPGGKIIAPLGYVSEENSLSPERQKHLPKQRSTGRAFQTQGRESAPPADRWDLLKASVRGAQRTGLSGMKGRLGKRRRVLLFFIVEVYSHWKTV